MRTDLPKFSRMLQRQEDEPDFDKPLWRPPWSCYCCHDTGFVVYSLVRMVIRDYDGNKDKPVVCHRFRIKDKFGEVISLSSDWRFNDELCSKLDRIARDDWAMTLEKMYSEGKEGYSLDLSKIGKNMRMRNRTSEEEMEALRKHQDCIER
jgi:hypothetical protein